MKRELKLVVKILIWAFIFAVPYISHIAVKSMVEKEGRKIRSIEAEILKTKKSINNLEKIFSERIDYKRIEKEARKMGFDYIDINRNKIFVLKE